MPKVNNGDVLPSFTAEEVGNGTTTVPDAVRGHWALVLFYRGHW
jgi:peroxiredoxin